MAKEIKKEIEPKIEDPKPDLSPGLEKKIEATEAKAKKVEGAIEEKTGERVNIVGPLVEEMPDSKAEIKEYLVSVNKKLDELMAEIKKTKETPIEPQVTKSV